MTPNNDEVICPNCVHQFRAIPQNVQQLMLDVGFKPPFTNPAQPEPVAHDVIAGVLFDFMAWLTSRPKRIMLSSADDASPAVDAIRDFAKMRGLSLDDAKVQDWQEALAQSKQEPVAWVYPEGLEALKAGKPWTAYGTRQEPNNTALYLSPQPDILPYAWVTFTPYGDEDDVWYENPEGQLLEGWTYKPLYDTTPPQRPWVGLTDDEIGKLYRDGWSNNMEFARAIEAKLRSKNG